MRHRCQDMEQKCDISRLDTDGEAEVNVKKIYFDMDGVLADFNRGVVELCGMKPMQPGKKLSPEEDDEMWEGIRKTGYFYDMLELMPGAKQLFDTVYGLYGDRCEILTGIPKPKRGIVTAGEDKIRWVRRMLSKDVVVNIVYRHQKPEYCSGTDCILIDDLDQNILAWEEIGGTGILHTSVQETFAALEKLCVLSGGRKR